MPISILNVDNFITRRMQILYLAAMEFRYLLVREERERKSEQVKRTKEKKESTRNNKETIETERSKER